jgi:putative addiction module killer protein
MPKNLDKPYYVLYEGQSYALEQTTEFADWLNNLRDRSGRIRILKRLSRLADGNFGDVKPVGDGVCELRMFFGPGYRAYFMQKGEVVVLLLAGGDKDSQFRDITLAKELAKNERDGNERDGTEDNTL